MKLQCLVSDGFFKGKFGRRNWKTLLWEETGTYTQYVSSCIILTLCGLTAHLFNCDNLKDIISDLN